MEKIKSEDFIKAFSITEEIKGAYNMDNDALKIVKNYVINQLNKTDAKIVALIYIVWKCKTLQNWKYLISTSLLDGMYYELTYNGDANEWYLDAYKKIENIVIKKGENEN